MGATAMQAHTFEQNIAIAAYTMVKSLPKRANKVKALRGTLVCVQLFPQPVGESFGEHSFEVKAESSG